jgi:hypothetical protein
VHPPYLHHYDPIDDDNNGTGSDDFCHCGTNISSPFVAANSTTGPGLENTGLQANMKGLLTLAEGVFLATPAVEGATASTTSRLLPVVTGTLGTSEGKTSGCTFNAQSSKNVPVYFGQISVTDTTTLEAQCAESSIDIVVLALVVSQLDGGSYPAVNFGSARGGQRAKMAAQAPGLLSCPELASNIEACQNTYGKKVLLSIGGATSQFSFSSGTQASNFSDLLWNIFGSVVAVWLAGVDEAASLELPSESKPSSRSIMSIRNIICSSTNRSERRTSRSWSLGTVIVADSDVCRFIVSASLWHTYCANTFNPGTSTTVSCCLIRFDLREGIHPPETS